MNCREFHQGWNEILDARSEGSAERVASLAIHATTCEPCQAAAIRYQVLRQAVAAWGPAPTLSTSSADRIKASIVAPKSRKRARAWIRIALPMATAAAALVLAWTVGPWAPKTPVPPVTLTSPVAPTRPIESALEEATSATIDLALEASAPAARIGRDVLGYEEDFSTEAEVPSTVDVGSASGMLQTVGERVRPISGSARHAFRFLLGPPPVLEKSQGATH